MAAFYRKVGVLVAVGIVYMLFIIPGGRKWIRFKAIG